MAYKDFFEPQGREARSDNITINFTLPGAGQVAVVAKQSPSLCRFILERSCPECLSCPQKGQIKNGLSERLWFTCD